MAKHFLNPDLCAANVLEIDLAAAPLAAALALADRLQAVTDHDQILRLEHDGAELVLSAKRPETWGSDISWWSADDPHSFGYFQALFDALDIAKTVEPYVDFENEICLFAGFFVIRRMCAKEHFHADWVKGNNDGFTLLAPLTANAHCGNRHRRHQSHERSQSRVPEA
jgi:hypothetical protein